MKKISFVIIVKKIWTKILLFVRGVEKLNIVILYAKIKIIDFILKIAILSNNNYY